MLYAVIMAGGAGTRFWPESRARRPKQLLPMLGDRTLLQTTVDRLGDLVPPDRVLVATTAALAGSVAEQLSQLPREAILIEPCKRDTAPCIALAALRIVRADPQAVMAVMPADHVIQPEQEFREAIRLAVALVEERAERFVTFGIRPTYPAETFGYIERGNPLASAAATNASAPVYSVRKFHEKPNRQTAEAYLASGGFYWNGGIFVWKAKSILQALARFQPALFSHLQRIAEAVDSQDFDEILRREFAAIEGVSIDYAVMERAEEVVVIEAPFCWDDLGSWRALERHGDLDSDGNLLEGARCVAINTKGTIARSSSPGHLIALVGVKDLVVVVTPDATLVASKAEEESIRKVIAELESRNWREWL